MIGAGLKHADDTPRLISALNAELDATQWPRVSRLEYNGEHLELHLHIAAELRWFEGHFPDNPVLPGVVQVHWAVTLAKKLLVENKPFHQVENLKFKSVVQPETDLILRFSEIPESAKIRFSFVAAASKEVHSEGRLSFA